MSKPKTIPISKLLNLTLKLIEDEANRKINDAVSMEVETLKLPEGTRLDPDRRVWVIPGSPDDK